MFGWGPDLLVGLAHLFSDPVGTVTGWTFDKVTEGIYNWLARGLVTLIEWVWQVLDAGTTPRLSEDWFANDLAGRVIAVGLAVTVAMMLASAIQAALAGRPEQVGDAVKEAARAIVASAFTVTVVDLMIGLVDEASAEVWRTGRGDLVKMVEGLLEVSNLGGPLAQSFVGPLCLLFGFIGLVGLSVSMLMRSALIYLVAGLAPIVWSSSVLPLMRESSRRLVHLLVALVVSKLAVVISLVVAVKLASHPVHHHSGIRPDLDAATAVGTLLTGFAAFLVAAISPMVLYRLMPTVEHAVTSSGVVGGWGRSLLSFGQAGMMARSATAAAAATRAVAGQRGVEGHAVTGLAARTPDPSHGRGSPPGSRTAGVAARRSPPGPRTGRSAPRPPRPGRQVDAGFPPRPRAPEPPSGDGESS